MIRKIVFVILVFTQVAVGQADRVAVKDLRTDWIVPEKGSWIPFDQRSEETSLVYFTIEASRFKGNRLEITGPREFSVWINGQLIEQAKRGGAMSFDIDSLSGRYTQDLTVAVMAGRGLPYMGTSITGTVPAATSDDELLRPSNYLLDFVLLGALMLALFSLILLQFNRLLTLEYFNFVRLFSLQERDETLVAGRITSRFSFLVYIFIGLWCSFVLLLIFHYARDRWIIVSDFGIRDLGDGFLKWGQLTLIVYAVLFAKVSVVLILSWIFRFREGASIQVLNYFRLLGLVQMILSVILVSYFVASTKNASYYENLIHLTGWMMGVWAVLIFVKLLNKSRYSVFHLFSYLCASEFFPIVILFKVLFF